MRQVQRIRLLIEEWMAEHGLGQNQFAVYAGIGTSTLTSILKRPDTFQPEPHTVLAIAKYIHQDPADLLDWAGHDELAEVYRERRALAEDRLSELSVRTRIDLIKDLDPEQLQKARAELEEVLQSVARGGKANGGNGGAVSK